MARPGTTPQAASGVRDSDADAKTATFHFTTKAKNGRRVEHSRPITKAQATDPVLRAAVISYAQACHPDRVVNWRFS